MEYGIAVIGGAVSGGVEIIDLDNWDVVAPWTALVDEQAPGLLDRLVRVRSPRPGLHVYYRCAEFGGNQKLARVPDPAKDNKEPKTVIEVKGAAGYCLAPPSPAACHPTGRPYKFAGAEDLTGIPAVTPDERHVMLSAARRLNAWERPGRPEYSPAVRRTPAGGFLRPGDAFNSLADWADILGPHGWTWATWTGAGSDQWRRPGKSAGVSATTGFARSDLLYVFSTNAHPFEEGVWYTKFRAFALLSHGGDFRAAARDLAGQGYGSGNGGPRRADPLARYSVHAHRDREGRRGPPKASL